MKLKLVSLFVALMALMAVPANAQLGGLGGLAGGKATPESLMADLTSGQEALLQALEFFNQALNTKTNLAKVMAEIKAAKGAAQSQAVVALGDETLKAADAMIASGAKLTKEQKDLANKAKTQIGIAVIKYGLLGAALAKSGDLEAQVATAIKEGLVIVPTVTKLSKVIGKINKLKVAK